MRGCAIIAGAVLFLVTIGLKLASLGLRHEIETDSKTRVEVIQTYFETGGDMAEQNIRHLAGYCAEKEAGGTVPQALKEYAGDLFIYLVTDTQAKSQEEMMREFLSRDPQRFSRQMEEIENAPKVEQARVVVVFEKWKEDGIFSHIGCVHHQLEARGLLPTAEG